MEYFGWMSTFLLGISGIPILWQTIRQGHAEGYSRFFILIVLIGEICGLIYTIYIQDLIISLNYLLNSGIYAIIFSYQIRRKFDRRKSETR